MRYCADHGHELAPTLVEHDLDGEHRVALRLQSGNRLIDQRFQESGVGRNDRADGDARNHRPSS
jgi:hypothetical protein